MPTRPFEASFLMAALLCVTGHGCAGGALGSEEPGKEARVPPPSRPYVVGGQELSRMETAALGLVALLVDPARPDRKGVCSGVVVGKRLILTAAHCLSHPLGALKMAVFGNDAFDPRTDRVPIASHARHRTADLAVLTLAADIPENWTIARPLLSLQGTLSGQTGRVAGFGRAGTQAPLTSGIARQGNTRFAAFEVGMPIIPVNSGSGRGLCFGDSGGPLFVRVGGETFVAGVLAQGATTCESGLDTYTSVVFHADWVRAEINPKFP